MSFHMDGEVLLQIHDSYDAEEWNRVVGQLPNCSILQSWQWGEIKSRHAWNPKYLLWKKNEKIVGAALALIREQGMGFLPVKEKIMYIPHGPLLNWDDHALRKSVLANLQSFARESQIMFVKIDPQVVTATGAAGDTGFTSHAQGLDSQRYLQESGWVYSSQQIQFKNTFVIDLRPPEETILSAMKQKTRYNIRLAGRKNVNIRMINADELGTLYEMYAATALRDGFIIRARQYYEDIWRTMMNAKMASALLAEAEGVPIAGLVLFHFQNKSYYFYGMSVESHREKMPNHLLQWEAIRLSKALGCLEYDLWGAPDQFDDRDRMWGVSKFKDGFGGQVRQTIGAYDYPISLLKYRIFTVLLPAVLSLMRKLRFRQIRQELE